VVEGKLKLKEKNGDAGIEGGRYLAIARHGKEAANDRRSYPATHVHHKVVAANKELTCFILCHRDVLCLLLSFFPEQRVCG
jgi:hypothetical protein